MNEKHHVGLTILPVTATCERLNCSRSWLYDRINRKSPHFNPDLPQPIHKGSRVGFIEHEIDDYILGLMRARGGVAER